MALNPLGLAPLAITVGIVAVAVLGSAFDSVDRRLTRLARRLFSRYLEPAPERERQLEAAYIGESYRSYAARTYLFTGMGAIGGATAGAYAVGGFLLLVPTIVDLLMGLPRTMVAVLGIRGFELILTESQTLIILSASGVVFGGVTGGLTYLMRWELPRNRADVRQRNIDAGMARTIAFMYALSRGGTAFPDTIGILARNQDIYGENAREFAVTVREMNLFGRDMISSIKRMNERTPSERFKTFSENLSSVLQSGQSLSSFLRNQYERHHEEAAERQEDLLESLATVAEGYVTIFVAGVLFLITILLVFGLTTTDTLDLLQLLAYLAIPLSNIGFMVYLSSRLDALGIGDDGTTDALDRHETASMGRPTTARSGVADGGVVPGADDNRVRLEFYDRIKSVKRAFRSPLRSLIWNPTKVLYLSVPIALVLFAVRVPAVFQTTSPNVRLLDDLVVQSLLLVLGSFAIVRTVYSRRVAKIEAATPELLERLASLNEAGMTLVESFRRVRGSDVGVLSVETERIWADIRMGANVDDALIRFGRRIRTTSISRVVTLLTNAMHASGQLGPVLRIAATQARADHRLDKRRKQQMLTYLVVIYISFAVFLVIIVAVQEVLVPALPSSVPTPASETNRLGVNVDQFARIGRVDKAAYTLVFFHTALAQAILTGFIGGQLGEGSLKDGAKHAAILLGIAYVSFILLSSPVASMTVENPTIEGNTLTVDSASLSAGGFVVVHDGDEDDEVIAVSRYLEPGTHEDVRIQIDNPPPRGSKLTLVAHQDTDEDRLMEYDFEIPGKTDRPYAASGQSDTVSIEIELQ